MFKSKAFRLSTLLLAVTLLGACGSDTLDDTTLASTDTPDSSPVEGVDTESDTDTDTTTNPDFELRSSSPSLVLVEGDPEGLTIPFTLSRNNGHDLPISLEIRGVTDEDVAFVTTSPSPLTLTVDESASELSLVLAIGDVPIQSQTRDFLIVASDGNESTNLPISVSVQPTSAPDVYLLAGQSNMVGFSGEGTRESEAGGLDEPNVRILQLNVSRNDENSVFIDDEDYTSDSVNAIDPFVVEALDPLHIPREPDSPNGKDEDFIGLGLSFAKRALNDTSADIMLVPAAWSGTAFCDNGDTPPGNWNAAESDNENLGNTLVFDRAVTRANLALRETGGVFRGILWHQGESDANDRCAPLYQQNLQNLAQGLRDQIIPLGDENLIRADSTIPFVVGTMSRGVDEREDLSVFPESKQLIDDVHRNVAALIDHSEVSIHDDLVPANGFPCGNSSCIHFGPGALREIGTRYYDAMLRAIAQ